MSILSRIRLYHAALAILAVLAYVTGELGLIHAWLGYGVSVIIVFRVLWALKNDHHLGLMRFYPSFAGLKADNVFTHPVVSRTFILGIAASLILVALTGIAIDQGKSLSANSIETASIAQAHDDTKQRGEEGKKEEGPLAETHEFFANMLLLFVCMHVTYLFLFKRPLATFMLFIPRQTHTPD